MANYSKIFHYFQESNGEYWILTKIYFCKFYNCVVSIMCHMWANLFITNFVTSPQSVGFAKCSAGTLHFAQRDQPEPAGSENTEIGISTAIKIKFCQDKLIKK